MINPKFKVGDKVKFRPDIKPGECYWNDAKRHCWTAYDDILMFNTLLQESWRVEEIQGNRSNLDFGYVLSSLHVSWCVCPVEQVLIPVRSMLCNSLL